MQCAVLLRMRDEPHLTNDTQQTDCKVSINTIRVTVGNLNSVRASEKKEKKKIDLNAG
jgi:hypothetical protein